MKNIAGVLLILLLVVAFSSCGTAKKAAAPGPKVSRDSIPPLPELPESRINIPVSLHFSPMLRQMDDGMAKEFTSEKWPDYIQSTCNFRYKYRFIRSPLKLTLTNNRVDISFQGSYQIAGSKSVCAFGKQVSPWVSGSCGFGSEPLRKVNVSISSFLNLQSGYQVSTSTRLEQLVPIDKCTVSLMQTDVTAEIMDSIRSSIYAYCSSFDNMVASVNEHKILQDWRQNGNSVVAVKEYGFLNLRPTKLRLSKFNYVKDSLQFSVGFNGRPQFSSDSLSIVTPSYLPTFTNEASAPGIAGYLNASYNYTALTSLLNDSLQNKIFEVDGRTFVIREVTVGGTAIGKLMVDLRFDGYKKGTLHLSGTPMLDTATQVLSMPDISFSVESRDMLINMAKSLFRKRILKQLRNQSVLDLAALIESNKPAIEARMNQPLNEWLSTVGSCRKLRIVGLRSTRDHIQLQVYLEGELVVVGNPSNRIKP